MSLQTPLARVRGLGSARRGTLHWWRQRLSAVALLPLSLWFIYELTTLNSLEYGAARVWAAAPATAVLLALFIPTLFYHAQAGLQVVVEDYVKSEGLKLALLVLMKFMVAVCAVVALLAVAKIHLEA